MRRLLLATKRESIPSGFCSNARLEVHRNLAFQPDQLSHIKPYSFGVEWKKDDEVCELLAIQLNELLPPPLKITDEERVHQPAPSLGHLVYEHDHHCAFISLFDLIRCCLDELSWCFTTKSAEKLLFGKILAAEKGPWIPFDPAILEDH